MISRSLRTTVRICQTRYISSLLNHPHSVTVEDIKKSNFKGDLQDSIKLIETINNSTNENKGEINQLLIPNFSTYFKLPRELINSDVLLRLLQVNPGRVHTSMELFEKYESVANSEMVKLLVDRLVLGEEYEIKALAENEAFTPSQDNVDKLIKLLKKYEINDDMKVDLLEKIKDEAVLTTLIEENIISTPLLLKYISQDKFDKDQTASYLNILKYIFSTSPEQLNIKQVVDILVISRKYNRLTEEILEYISTNELDMPSSSLLLRIELIEQYGIYQDDLEETNKLYHKYQSHCKFGLHLIQYQMFKSYIYQSINQDKEILLTVANTLVNPEELNVRTLQCLIVGNYANDQGLQTFNDYIDQVSKEVKGKRSSSGYLTEALILATLYNNDRNLASLILDKAEENGIVTDEYEIAQLKSQFKAYGQSFVENDDWAEAKPNFKVHVLEYIKNL